MDCLHCLLAAAHHPKYPSCLSRTVAFCRAWLALQKVSVSVLWVGLWSSGAGVVRVVVYGVYQCGPGGVQLERLQRPIVGADVLNSHLQYSRRKYGA